MRVYEALNEEGATNYLEKPDKSDVRSKDWSIWIRNNPLHCPRCIEETVMSWKKTRLFWGRRKLDPSKILVLYFSEGRSTKLQYLLLLKEMCAVTPDSVLN